MSGSITCRGRANFRFHGEKPRNPPEHLVLNSIFATGPDPRGTNPHINPCLCAARGDVFCQVEQENTGSKKATANRGFFVSLVGRARFELATNGLKVQIRSGSGLQHRSILNNNKHLLAHNCSRSQPLAHVSGWLCQKTVRRHLTGTP